MMMAVSHATIGRQRVSFWTVGAVKARLHQMGRTLKRLPGSNADLTELAGALIYRGGDTPRRVKTAQERFLERLGREELKETETPLMRLLPTPAEITEMDECIEWFGLLDTVEKRRAAWAWALGIGARRLGRRLGVNKDQAHRLTMNAMEELVVALNKKL